MRFLIPSLTLLLLIFSCKNEKESSPSASVQPLFVHIDAAQSGLSFKPEITETFEYNFLVDPYQYNGGGVAVLDFDNDGLQDIFFTYRFNGCRLYRNKGAFEFEDISEASGVAQHSGLKTGVVPVDINADGWMDLYVCRTWLTPLPERNNLLLVNNQDGTFSEKAKEYGLSDLAPSQCANFFDYDKDGDLDLYLVNHPVDFTNINTINYRPTAAKPFASAEQPKIAFDSDKFYENQGGKFIDKTAAAGLQNRAWGLSVTASDFNADGWPDLLVGNDFVAPDFLYINQKDGTFKDEAHRYFRHTANHSMGCDIADINNDGLADFFVADMLGSTHERRKALMSTMVLERQQALLAKGYGDQQMRNALQINNGNGSFSEVACLAGAEATEWSWAPLIADFDLDGWKDIFLSSGVYRDLNDVDFFFYTADSIQQKHGSLNQKDLGTFDAFTKTMTSRPIQNFIFKNQGGNSLQMQEYAKAWGLQEEGFTNGAAYADFDLDGDLDLVMNRTEDVPLLYKNTAADKQTTNWLQISCKGTAQNPQGIGAKIQVFANGQIHYHEIATVRGFYSASEPIAQVGLGKSTTAERIEIQWPNGTVQGLENIKANQRLVLDIKNAKAGQLSPMRRTAKQVPTFKKVNNIAFQHKENTFEDFNRERLLLRRYSRQGPCLATADVNGDGSADVFIGGASGQAARLFLQGGDGSFIEKSQSSFGNDKDTEDVAALFFDADGDGDMDVYCVSGGNEATAGNGRYQNRLYLNDSMGNFSKTKLPSEVESGSCVKAHDYDGDGDLDLFIGGRVMPGKWPIAPRSFILQNNKGIFTDITKTVAPDFLEIGMVTDIEFADLDGDASPELIVVGEWMPVQIFSYKNERFEQNPNLTPSKSNGFWNCLQVADMDGDGDMDIITGNEGLNTRLEASPEQPLRVYFDDFDKNGSIDPIVSYKSNRGYAPLFQRNELGTWMPSIVKKKYPRYKPYARAQVEDIFGKKAIRDADYLDIHTLASAWWENTKEGFIRHDFSDYAQMSCVKDMVVHDFDKNGSPDVLLVGNDTGNHVETGPYDASNGALLLNDGKGNFSYIPNHLHGFWADGEVRSIASCLSAKGDLLWLLGINDGPLRVYQSN